MGPQCPVDGALYKQEVRDPDRVTSLLPARTRLAQDPKTPGRTTIPTGSCEKGFL